MRFLAALILIIIPLATFAQEWEDEKTFNAGAGTTLRVISSTDTELFSPLVESFVASNPGVTVDYFTIGSADLDRLFRANPSAFDIVISSAMDLQLKLANDGFAAALDLQHPEWAKWRQSLYAFTSEPSAVVINRAAFEGHPVPTTRQELIQALRARPEVFMGRVGTYDIRQSGLGYLFATQDARASETFWRLMELMGGLDVRLYCCSGDMVDDLATGDIAVAYNVVGNYAVARTDVQDKIQVILPADFPITMMRTAMVSKETEHLGPATAFVAHLIAEQTGPGNRDPALPSLVAEDTNTERARIALEPALMTYLDALKRQKFLAEWEDAVIQP